jgi:amino acid permease
MTRDQKIVAIGAASGVIAMIAAVSAIYHLWPADPGLTDANHRLAYTLQANGFAVLPLLIGIIAVGNNRFLSAAIDPTLRKEDRGTQINARVVENTLQQFLLFLVGTLALAVNLTAEQMRAIPAVTVVFIAARIAFWIGYRIHPLYRAFGMAATGYLNVGLLVFALWKTLR